MAERPRESIETKTEKSPEKLASDAVSALEAKDKSSKKWVDGGLSNIGKGGAVLGLVGGYGIIRLALKAIEVSANVLEHVANNMTNMDDLKFWSGLAASTTKSFKSDKKEK